MQSALWVSKTGLQAQDVSLRTISNNLANVSTTGFKRDRAMFQDLMYQIEQQPGGMTSQDTTNPSGLQLGVGVRVAGTQKDFSEGSVQRTGQSLDLAVEGRGLFQITLPDGNIGYTRSGEFQLDQDGRIVTAQGFPMEPAINIPAEATEITIGVDGTVSVTEPGNASPSQIGTISLVSFQNPGGLEAAGGNLFLETAASGSPQQGTPGENGLGQIVQGALETSNVSVVEELVNMVATQRAYEMNSRVVSTADQMLQYITPEYLMMSASKFALILLGVAGLQGCITVDPVRPEPLYSPTYPVVPPAAPASAGSIFQGARSVDLYEDARANQIGDVVTIFFEERTRSSKSAETAIRKESNTELPNPTVFGNVIDGNSDTDLNSIDNSTDFSGEAESDQENSLSGTLTAVVADVLPNGLLLVQGEKWLNLNRGEEYLRVSGLLRPEDIDGNNAVSSLRLADARIAYSGTGELASANSSGWLTRFFLNPVYPF